MHQLFRMFFFIYLVVKQGSLVANGNRLKHCWNGRSSISTCLNTRNQCAKTLLDCEDASVGSKLSATGRNNRKICHLNFFNMRGATSYFILIGKDVEMYDEKKYVAC